MKLGILKEKLAGEMRVSLTPASVAKIKLTGFEVWVEKNAGKAATFSDEEYKKQGAKIVDRKEILAKVDVLLSIHPIADKEIKSLHKNQFFISSFKPYSDKKILDQLKKTKCTIFSLDMIPRTSIAQSMDVLSSMASLSGYKSVLMAASYLPKQIPMSITAAGSIRPAKVFVVGAGVAGLQAIATAKKLGAVVTATDTRAAAIEEIQSLGAKFMFVDGAKEAVASGYGAEQNADYIKKQRETLSQHIAESDMVICTALVRSTKAPIIITNEMISTMKNGSVIVDLATSIGGNCEGSEHNKVISTKNGVTIIGDINFPSQTAVHASELYSNNVCNFLNHIWQGDKFKIQEADEIFLNSCIHNNIQNNKKK